MPKLLEHKPIEGFIKKFLADRTSGAILLSAPDYAYYHKRAEQYFKVKERMEAETDYAQRNILSYKISVIVNDFEELRRNNPRTRIS